jgi:hypothetical protein
MRRRWHQIALRTLNQQVNYPEMNSMKILAIAVAGILIASTAAFAQQPSAGR